MNFLNYALAYAKLGIAVFPLKPGDKMPLGGNGEKDATTDTAVITEWWTRNPTANIGLGMGARSGVFAVDIDGPDGRKTLSDLIEKYGSLPQTWTHHTPNGTHLLFRYPGRQIMNCRSKTSRKEPLPKIDSRGDGGYIVGAPSIHPSGTPYRWDETLKLSAMPVPADAPEWLVYLFEKPPAESKPAKPAKPISSQGTPYGLAVLKNECERIRTAPIGQQEEILNARAFVVGQYIGGGELDEISAINDLVSAGMGMANGRANEPWTESQVSKKVHAAVQSGMRDPKTAPEKPAQQNVTNTKQNETQAKQNETDAAGSIESGHFKFLGFEKSESGAVFVFFVFRSLTIIKLTNAGITSGNLLLLNPSPDFWETHFPGKRGGIDLQVCSAWIIKSSYAVGMFDESLIRGRGAWIDDGRVVIHAGDHLIVNGKLTRLQAIQSNFMYEQAPTLPVTVDSPLSDSEAAEVIEIAKLINFERKNDAYLLAGWCVIAPVCGALAWRPHLWITGGAGSGKSWVLKNYVRPLLAGISVILEGTTTEAGIRQKLYQDALPVVFDEADTDDRKDQERVQQILTLMRISSSSDGGSILKGSSTGKAVEYTIRSCFVMASIVLQAARQADKTRITVINIRRPLVMTPEVEQRWKDLSFRTFQTFTPEFVRRLQARTILHLDTLVKNAKTISTAIAAEVKYQRTGDQMGILIAGALLLKSTALLTLDQAVDIVKQIDFSEEKSADEQKDEMQLLQHLCDQVVNVDFNYSKVEKSIGEMLIACRLQSFPDQETTAFLAKLGRCGLKPSHTGFIVSNQNDYLKRILRDTPWGNGYPKILSRLDGAVATDPIRFPSGAQTRGVLVPWKYITDGE